MVLEPDPMYLHVECPECKQLKAEVERLNKMLRLAAEDQYKQETHRRAFLADLARRVEEE